MFLFRTSSDDEGTGGVIVFGDEYLHTIEPPWRDNRRGLSCIPAGDYDVSMRNSPRYGPCYEVKNVTNRTHILLHNGNWAGDESLGFKSHSDGCIILGSSAGRLSDQKAVLASRRARRKFEETMNFEPFKLEIVELF